MGSIVGLLVLGHESAQLQVQDRPGLHRLQVDDAAAVRLVQLALGETSGT